MPHNAERSSSSVVLYRCPPTLSLPTADPHALAVECMLRFVGAHYVRRDAAMPVSIEVPVGALSDEDTGSTTDGPVVSGPAKFERRTGLSACMQLIESCTHLDAEILPSSQLPLSTCIRALVEKMLLPAFVYITHSEANLFYNSIRKAVVPKVGTFWQQLRGTYRMDVLKRSVCCGRYNSVGQALEEIENGLRSLDALCVANASSTGLFILGTRRPGSTDALAYAAASSFFHADFTSRSASGTIVNAQRRLKEQCPDLVSYVERLRLQYFDDYSAFYSIRATKTTQHTSDAAQQAKAVSFKGRWKLLTFTGVFSLVYFVLANADVFLQLLTAFEEDEMDDEAPQ
ncbi:hypothetical protein ERJ75_000460600 [Trypanosoma vivax]|uniref:Metaxin glutathione S-transferase domain-containing protein n=1 Tax=Trypanosoma vivax (strain Y486) TaxID=1055687 RepID=G0U543_TRYVY|nr:hypothetical protein TRVL_06525 [Trypanosoma vivax]KAH8616589.1 hypothetical protein ERJ75_000460600 [Trypanosoma vivax]CCC50991.1 conserved hypothetical protein [Trypanosoma vivax Y486]